MCLSERNFDNFGLSFGNYKPFLSSVEVLSFCSKADLVGFCLLQGVSQSMGPEWMHELVIRLRIHELRHFGLLYSPQSRVPVVGVLAPLFDAGEIGLAAHFLDLHQ